MDHGSQLLLSQLSCPCFSCDSVGPLLSCRSKLLQLMGMQIWLNGRWKREAMFKITVYVARMLMEVGQRDALFRYVPEFYVEAVVDACHALRGSGTDDKPSDGDGATVLAGPGLSDIIVFLTLYFHDARIINPDVREALLQSISMLMQSSVSVLPQPSVCVLQIPAFHLAHRVGGHPFRDRCPARTVSLCIG